MKELAVLLLVSAVLVASGCVGQQTGQDQQQPAQGTGNEVTAPDIGQTAPEAAANLTASNAALYSDADSIATEAAGIDTTDLDTVMAPITAGDMTAD